MTLGNNTIWMISPDVRSTYTEDGAVLLDIKKGVCYGLNPTAARVWGTIEDNQWPQRILRCPAGRKLVSC